MPGKVYENVKELADAIKEFRERNREKIGANADGSANIEVLRIFGKQLAKFKKDGKEYWDIEDGVADRFINGRVYRVEDFRIDVDFIDYRRYEESGGKEKPERIFHLIINKENVREFRLQPAIKKIKPKI